MRIRMLLLCGLIFWVIIKGIGTVETFLDGEVFRIKKIEITGNNTILKDDIIDKFELIKDRGIWFFDIKRIKEYVKKDVRIKNFKIKLKIPDKAYIYIEEREPYINILYKNKVFVADKDGVIFGKRLEFSSKEMLILDIEDEKELEALYVELSKVSENFKEEISEIYGSEEKIIFLLKDGVEIKAKEDLDKKKYEVAYKLYLKLKEQGKKIEYIDLRFQDYIVK